MSRALVGILTRVLLVVFAGEASSTSMLGGTRRSMGRDHGRPTDVGPFHTTANTVWSIE